MWENEALVRRTKRVDTNPCLFSEPIQSRRRGDLDLDGAPPPYPPFPRSPDDETAAVQRSQRTAHHKASAPAFEGDDLLSPERQPLYPDLTTETLSSSATSPDKQDRLPPPDKSTSNPCQPSTASGKGQGQRIYPPVTRSQGGWSELKMPMVEVAGVEEPWNICCTSLAVFMLHGISSSDGCRKRPLIPFDGSSTDTGSVKLKKAEAPMERLKPPVSSINLTNPIRKLSGTHTNCSNSNNRTLLSSGGGAKSPSNPLHLADSNNAPSKLKRTSPGEAAAGSAQKDIQSPEVKKKIQHVTWP
ncbi:hypothetical protein DNTS_014920 [Danionella cerebrum]|uniref:Ashwin n=1 Tax=Danionella cerebrum TaxID=2873325 RepID=A0A553MKP8_9TELE|nr:hypothetical protein DNTS_014920 [Danionella translucida]